MAALVWLAWAPRRCWPWPCCCLPAVTALTKCLKGNFKGQGLWSCEGERVTVKTFFCFVCVESWNTVVFLHPRRVSVTVFHSLPGPAQLQQVWVEIPQAEQLQQDFPGTSSVPVLGLMCAGSHHGRKAMLGVSCSPSARGVPVCAALLSRLQMLLQHIVIKCHGTGTQLCTVIIRSVAYNSSLDCHWLGIKQ